ncbi:MAG: DUF4054 domain-containing protein [Azoarcus sp.]|jgi:hypothetical protein|nr:DUF4054 domain-containing protein [Azoarcus sp.]
MNCDDDTGLSLYAFMTRFPELKGNAGNDVVMAALERARHWLKVPACIDDGGESYYLLAAHFIAQSLNVAAGATTFGAPTNASVGSVSVGMQVPTVRTAWQAWLAGTPYGQQLWAWLALKAAGAWSVGGLPERSAFRKTGGVFW